MGFLENMDCIYCVNLTSGFAIFHQNNSIHFFFFISSSFASFFLLRKASRSSKVWAPAMILEGFARGETLLLLFPPTASITLFITVSIPLNSSLTATEGLDLEEARFSSSRTWAFSFSIASRSFCSLRASFFISKTSFCREVSCGFELCLSRGFSFPFLSLLLLLLLPRDRDLLLRPPPRLLLLRPRLRLLFPLLLLRRLSLLLLLAFGILGGLESVFLTILSTISASTSFSSILGTFVIAIFSAIVPVPPLVPGFGTLSYIPVLESKVTS